MKHLSDFVVVDFLFKAMEITFPIGHFHLDKNC